MTRLSLSLATVAALLGAIPARARAGVLGREALVQWFPAPLVVGERETSPPVWPIFRQSGPPAFTTDLVGYAFESVDLAPIPGFSGTPVDLLVAIDTNGELLDVRVLSQHEPVFLGGLGQEPLDRFASRYRGLNLRQSVKIGSASGARAASRSGSTNVYIDGIAKATASLRIVNQSVLAAALRVARAKLGFSGRHDPDLVAHVRTERFEPRTWRQLVDDGVVRHLALRDRDVERAFAGTEVAGVDPEATAHPDATFVDVYAALATVPTAGRNLLDDAGWGSLTARINPGDHVLLVMWKGRHPVLDEDFVRGSVPDRLSLTQGGLAVEMRDLDLDASLRPIGQPAFDGWRAFRVIAQAGLDPGAPIRLAIRVTRSRGIVYPERIGRDFALELTVPGEFLVPAAEDQKTWRGIWKARRVEIGVLLAALALLGWALAPGSPALTRARHLRWFRPAFQLFTLGFIGWYAQGQLSIVNVVALVQAARAGRSWAFFLYDPMSTILWIFALAALVLWGRGTFCGWLCPFGALQELVSRVARLARLPALRPPDAADRRLRAVKWAVLLAVVAAALASPRWGDAALEVEPFKTAITFGFVRAWPFAAYAIALVMAGAVVEKLFCRWLCPLGAFLAAGGLLRRLDWVPRRAECGRPCQTCRQLCAYRAIDVRGRVHYAECFQCMDCVAVYHGDDLCTPRILERRGRRTPLAAPPPRAQRAPGGRMTR